MVLRLTSGIDLGALENRFAIQRDELLVPAKLELYENLGMIWRDDNRLGVTHKGRPLLDGLLAELVSDRLVSA